jgi:ferritin-like metal-binding protein YciE
MAEKSKERLLRYLADAHAAETGETTTLTDVGDQSLDPEVTSAVRAHLATTQSHLSLLEQRIEALGGTTSNAKSFVDKAIAKGSNFVNAFHDDQDKQTQDLVKLFALQKFEVGAYTALKAFAQAVGDSDTAQLADTLLADEQQAADQFVAFVPKLAVASVNRTTDATINLHQQ